MYRGSRDIPVMVDVEQEMCFERSFSGRDYIEVMLPESAVPFNDWYSVVVDPDQVYYKNAYMNSIAINAGIVGKALQHDIAQDGSYRVRSDATTRYVTPYDIMRIYNDYRIAVKRYNEDMNRVSR